MAFVGANAQTSVARVVKVADGESVTLSAGTWVIAADGVGAPAVGILATDTAVAPSGNDVFVVVADTVAVAQPGIAAVGS